MKYWGVISRVLASHHAKNLQGEEVLPFQLEIGPFSQLNSCFLDRKHHTIDSRNLDFFLTITVV